MLPLTCTFERPGMRPISTSRLGVARRNFIIGSRLCPPARILASSFCCSSPIASSTDEAATYSKGAGYIVRRSFASLISHLCRQAPTGPYSALVLLRRLHGLPDSLGGQRHINMPDPEW